MKIGVLCNDTRGGVQPYVALALGLVADGHDVRAVAPAGLATLFSNRGVPVAELSTEQQTLMKQYGFAEMGTAERVRLMREAMPRLAAQTAQEMLAASEGVQLLTGGVGGMVAGVPVAEKLRVPFVPTHLQPIGLPGEAYAGVLLARMTPAWSGSVGRWISHALSDRAIEFQFAAASRTVRKTLQVQRGVAPATEGMPALYGFSRRVVPGREDSRHRITGYWQTEELDWTPPAKLLAFLEKGDPVVCIGFGSMVGQSPAELTETALKAATLAGVRVVLLTGWGGLQEVEDQDRVCSLQSAPHDWLFPRMSALVHHGGAGTTGAALHAGVPNMAMPFAADQFFWGIRVAALGCGPAPLPRKQLTVDRLAEKLRILIGDTGMRKTAETLGRELRAERGVEEAVRAFRDLPI